MKKAVFCFSALTLSAAAVLIACSGDDVTEGPADAGDDASPFDGSFPDTSTTDAATPDGGDADVSRPPWALITINYGTNSDLLAFSLTANAPDGVFNYASKYGGTSIASDGPWALEQYTDIVAKMDPAHPWQPTSSWNVRGATDGGDFDSYADPYKVVAGPAGKDYVLRFNRNQIAVLDTTQTGTNLAPKTFIDLKQYLDPTDADGEIDMVSGAYVASQHRLYVVLANYDLYNTDPNAYFTLCGTTHSEIVAIDTDTDSLVSAADGGTSTSAVVLGGYDALGSIYDVAGGKLLVVNAGCSDPATVDGGPPGATHMREIDSFDVATGVATKALDLDSADTPVAYAQIDATHLALRLDHYDFTFGAVSAWDTTTTSLGAVIPNAPDLFAGDGKGNLVGVTATYYADGGSGTAILSVNASDGGVTTLGVPPVSGNAPIFAAVDYESP
jgi:hypothetical protein